MVWSLKGFWGGASGKEPAFQSRRRRHMNLILGQEDHQEESTATHSSILPGKSYEWESLAGCSPWSLKESDDWSDLAHTHTREL